MVGETPDQEEVHWPVEQLGVQSVSVQVEEAVSLERGGSLPEFSGSWELLTVKLDKTFVRKKLPSICSGTRGSRL